MSTFSRPVLVPSQQIPYDRMETGFIARQDRPHTIFALSGRLLAFTSAPPSQEQSTQTRVYPRMATPQSPSIQIGPLNVSRADIGNAAMKVGGGLLSGMKALGGMAVAAARGESVTATTHDQSSGFKGLFFSRSAPAASGRHSHRGSPGSSVSGHTDAEDMDSEHNENDTTKSAKPTHITVFDLKPLARGAAAEPDQITTFSVPNWQVVSDLSFSEDGTRLSVIPSDASVVKVYQISSR